MEERTERTKCSEMKYVERKKDIFSAIAIPLSGYQETGIRLDRLVDNILNI